MDGSVERRYLTVEEAAELIGISRALAYQLCREFLATGTNGIPCTRIGSRRIVIARRSLERHLADTFDDGDDMPPEAA